MTNGLLIYGELFVRTIGFSSVSFSVANFMQNFSVNPEEKFGR
jgi:hypothetical protein